MTRVLLRLEVDDELVQDVMLVGDVDIKTFHQWPTKDAPTRYVRVELSQREGEAEVHTRKKEGPPDIAPLPDVSDKQKIWDIEEQVAALTHTLTTPFPCEVSELRDHYGTLHVHLGMLRRILSRRIDELEAVYGFR